MKLQTNTIRLLRPSHTRWSSTLVILIGSGVPLIPGEAPNWQYYALAPDWQHYALAPNWQHYALAPNWQHYALAPNWQHYALAPNWRYRWLNASISDSRRDTDLWPEPSQITSKSCESHTNNAKAKTQKTKKLLYTKCIHWVLAIALYRKPRM